MKNLNLRNQPFSIWETLHFVQVYLGSRLLALGEYNVPGTYSLQIATPDAPSRGHVTLVVTNRHGQVLQDRVAVRYVWRNLEILLFSIVIATTTTTTPHNWIYIWLLSDIKSITEHLELPLMEWYGSIVNISPIDGISHDSVVSVMSKPLISQLECVYDSPLKVLSER